MEWTWSQGKMMIREASTTGQGDNRDGISKGRSGRKGTMRWKKAAGEDDDNDRMQSGRQGLLFAGEWRWVRWTRDH